MHNIRNQFGATLMELAMTIALLAIIAGVSIPVVRQFQVKNDLDIAVQTVVQSLRRAQTLAVAQEAGASWGLSVQTGTITVFSGDSYASRNTTKDEVTETSPAIIPSGDTEIVFAQFTGDLASNKSMTLTSSTNEIRTITINTKGTITY